RAPDRRRGRTAHDRPDDGRRGSRARERTPGRGLREHEMTNPALLTPTDRDAFVRELGSIVEHSPWVAERAFADGPFGGLPELHAAFERALLGAPVDRKLAVLRAHPDLAVRER